MNASIGIFDSGLGGLTVVRAIAEALPHEDLIYLGDTARVPYGTRSPETVIRYARSCARKLEGHGIKLLVVACNTVSAVALPMLSVELDMPVLGVIGPGSRAGAEATRCGKVGVIATAGTVRSGAYMQAFAGHSSRVEVFSRPAPLLVPLAEEGWVTGPLPEEAVRRYLEPLVAHGIDTLVLGCTHYPLLMEPIRQVADALVGPELRVVDSAAASANELAGLLRERGLSADEAAVGGLRLLVTDLPESFAASASRFLGRELEGLSVEAVDL